ncbi:MAG: beta-propeller fold lactonase family protein [Verrucomicrobia bacterium]|nr:MAG: beta-propeller fold lactonase family protein [Verrucomicrobiota bacterium]
MIPRFPALAGVVLATCAALAAPAPIHRWVVSANENKLDLATGSQRILPGAIPDNLSLMDFSVFPPVVRHLDGVANTVLGPPSNVAITPDGRLALVADSIVLDPSRTNGWAPGDRIHVVDLASNPPAVVATTKAGPQPSGIAISRDGTRVAVANRAGGSVSAFRLSGTRLQPLNAVVFTESTNEVSDVAFSPDGRHVLAAVTQGGHLRVLDWREDGLVANPRRISTYGKPYRVQFTPDGQFALASGAGYGNADDTDALTVIEARGDAFRTVDFVPLASGPESFDISPDGRWIAAVLMNRSNIAPGAPGHRDHGVIVLVERTGDRFVRRQELATGAIPEGVVFTPDGRHLAVQCHPDRELRLYELKRGSLRDTGRRVPVPGMPSGIGRGP